MNVPNLIVGIGSLLAGADALKRAFDDKPKKRRRQLEDGVQAGDRMTVKTYTVKTISQRVGYIIQMIQKGRDNPTIRQRTVQILSQKCGQSWCVSEKDWPAEVEAVFKAVREHIRYTRDTYGKDLFQHPVRTFQFGGADCLPEGTLLLTDAYQLVPIEKLEAGTKIWGLNDWTEVKAAWSKGILPVDQVELNNGSSFKATADHKVYVALCPRHPVSRPNSPPCSCPISERSIERIRVAQLEEDMVLLQPERIPYGSRKMDAGRAHVEGLYLSDGWSGHPGDFCISGKDGFPKEAQKREVKQICKRLGVPTTWQEKDISVRDRTWAERVAQMGKHAPEKHALEIDLEEDAARELLRGIMADSGANTCGAGRTFTTTSRMLAIQARLLHRMAGRSCGERYIVDHGGLGQNPIWRLGVRDRKDGKAEKLLRVRAIDRNVMEVPVWDLSTDDHYVYLPEADVVVSNCDDFTIVLGSMLQSVGYPVRCRVIRTTDSDDWNHIYLMVGLPPRAPTRWVSLDASVDKPPGWEAPRSMVADVRDFNVP